mmetsp:Transcript_859/g.3585  ORF Transcript_859/g.3585 Transcript_859/m.3585 type:complete len:397 (-) Transcript_859:2051-3241(-)
MSSDEIDAASVYVGQVDYSCTPEQLKTLFESCGAVQRVTIPVGFGGHPKGFAYVAFADAASVDRALSLDGHEFLGRNLKIIRKRVNVPRAMRGGHARGRGRGLGRGRGRGRGVESFVASRVYEKAGAVQSGVEGLENSPPRAEREEAEALQKKEAAAQREVAAKLAEKNRLRFQTKTPEKNANSGTATEGGLPASALSPARQAKAKATNAAGETQKKAQSILSKNSATSVFSAKQGFPQQGEKKSGRADGKLGKRQAQQKPSDTESITKRQRTDADGGGEHPATQVLPKIKSFAEIMAEKRAAKAMAAKAAVEPVHAAVESAGDAAPKEQGPLSAETASAPPLEESAPVSSPPTTATAAQDESTSSTTVPPELAPEMAKMKSIEDELAEFEAFLHQ